MRLLSTLLAGVVLVTPSVSAQSPQSAEPARQLSQLLGERKLDSFAARIPGTADEFAAVLAFPGQMIVVWAQFSAPAVLNEKLLRGDYREVYIDLNSASDAATRNMVTDIGADGLGRGVRNQAADAHDAGTRSMRYDGSWREDKMTEQEYVKAHTESDAAYSRILGILLEELKKAG